MRDIMDFQKRSEIVSGTKPVSERDREYFGSFWLARKV